MLDDLTLKYLKENNYHFSKTPQGYHFSHKRDWSWLIILGGFMAVVIFIINIRSPLSGVLGCAGIGLIVAVIILSIKKKPFFEINQLDSLLIFRDQSIAIREATALKIQSDFVAEYTSAFKETSEEYRTTIHAHFNDETSISLFSFKTDYKEPSEPIIALYQFLKLTMKEVKEAR